MYVIGTKVYVKSVDRVGKVTERGYHRRAGTAWYLIKFTDYGGQNGDFMTGSKDLRNAEGGCCDGCSRYLPHGSFNQGMKGPEGLRFCFLCTEEAKNDYR
jgi:hypothetical protein